MNSKQRRRDIRLWSWRVDPVWPDGESFEEQLARYNRMWDWCKNNFGIDVERCGWRDRVGGRTWEFNDSKKAMMFKLKWG